MLDFFLEFCLDVFHEDEVREGSFFCLDLSDISFYEMGSIAVEKCLSHQDGKNYSHDHSYEEICERGFISHDIIEDVGELRDIHIF